METPPPIGGEDSDNPHDEITLGTLSIQGISPGGFNSKNAEINIRINGAEFETQRNGIYLFNGFSNTSDSISVKSSQLVTANIALKDGVNKLEFEARDKLGRTILWEKNVWSGERQLNYIVTNNSGSLSHLDYVRVELAADSNVYVELTDASLEGIFNHLPPKEPLVIKAGFGGLVATSLVSSNQNNVELSFESLGGPAVDGNNDFSKGIVGWNIVGGSPVVETYLGSPVAVLNATSGEIVKFKRSFVVPQASSGYLAVQFDPISLNDSFLIKVRSSSGYFNYITGLGKDFVKSDGLPMIQQWRSLSYETFDANEIVEIEGEFKYENLLSAKNFIQKLNLFEVANAGSSSRTKIIPYFKGNSFFIKSINLTDVLKEKGGVYECQTESGSLTLTLTSILSYPFLSQNPYKSSIHGGKNKICIRMDFSKKNDKEVIVEAARLVKVSEATPDSTDFINCLGSVNQPLMSSFVTKMNSKLSVTPKATNIVITEVDGLEIPANYFSYGNEESFTLKMLFQIRENWVENGVAKSERRCVTHEFKPTFEWLQDFGNTYSNRFGDRDDDNEGEKNYGGDGWGKLHISPFLFAYYYQYGASGISFNDISNLNGGIFPRHTTHREGVGIDLRSFNYNLIHAAAVTVSGAKEMIYAVYPNLEGNLSNKAEVTRIYSTLNTDPNNEVWSFLRHSCAKDGISLRSRIKVVGGHSEHFHLDFNKNPNDYINVRGKMNNFADFGFSNFDGGQIQFVPIDQRGDLTYSWVIKDSFGVVVQHIDRYNPVLDVRKPTLSLPPGEYSVSMTAFWSGVFPESGGRELCGQITKKILVNSEERCNGEVGNTYIDYRDLSAGGFVASGVSLPLDPNRPTANPIIDQKSQVCGAALIKGPARILDSKVEGKAQIIGNVEVLNKSKVKDAKIDFEANSCCSHFMTVNNGAEIVGNIIFSSPKNGRVNVSSYLANDIGPKIYGSGIVEDSSFGNQVIIDATNFKFINSTIRSSSSSYGPAKTTIIGDSIEFQNTMIGNSALSRTATNVTVDGSAIKIQDSAFGEMSTQISGSGISVVSTVFESGSNLSLNLGSGLFIANSRVKNSTSRTWTLSGKAISNALCSTFSPVKQNSVILYYYEPGVENGCRSSIGPGQYSLINQLD